MAAITRTAGTVHRDIPGGHCSALQFRCAVSGNTGRDRRCLGMPCGGNLGQLAGQRGDLLDGMDRQMGVD